MVIDPENHYMAHGPYPVAGRFVGTCLCGKELRGITRDDVWLELDRHILDLSGLDWADLEAAAKSLDDEADQ